MHKITPADIPVILNRPVIASSEDELKQIFMVLGFRLKEFVSGNDSYNFELHYKRTYIVRLSVDQSRLASFSNEYINFGDGCHGVSMALDHLKETILILFNMFMHKLRIEYDGTVDYNEDSCFSEQEFEALVAAINVHLLDNQSIES